mgnify:CR=1 FL=1
MFNKLIKLIVVFGALYQTPLYSKSASFNDFNSRDLSNYFSGIIAFENKDNSDALKFFNSSKVLLDKHDAYLKRYSFSLVLENKVAQAINVIKNSSNHAKENIDTPLVGNTCLYGATGGNIYVSGAAGERIADSAVRCKACRHS